MSKPTARAILGAASTTQGRPRTGTSAMSTPTISPPVAPAAQAASACSPKEGTGPLSDQGRDTDKGESLGVEGRLRA